MKPTPTQIDAAIAKTPFIPNTINRAWMAEALSAALSVPAAAVVGEPGPIGYCSEYGLDKLASQAHHYCLSVSKAQENEFQFPIYASRISHQDAELERLRKENQSLTEAAIIGEYMWTPAELHEARMEAFFVGWEMSNVASAEDTCAEAWEYFYERGKEEETRT